MKWTIIGYIMIFIFITTAIIYNNAYLALGFIISLIILPELSRLDNEKKNP